MQQNVQHGKLNGVDVVQYIKCNQLLLGNLVMIARRIVQILVVATAAHLSSLNDATAQQIRMRWQDFISGPDGAHVSPAW
jgi:hypothetical protein